VNGANLSDPNYAKSTTASAVGGYAVACPGFEQFRARISAISSGSITVLVRATNTLLGGGASFSSGAASPLGDVFFAGIGATHGEYFQESSSSELLTLSTVATTTDTTGNLLPASSVILAVDTIVTTGITTATSFSVGDATTGTRFANALASIGANSKNVGLAHWNSALITQIAAAKVRITTNVNPGSGVVRITTHYLTFNPPQS
jgi:hypothetical protein